MDICVLVVEPANGDQLVPRAGPTCPSVLRRANELGCQPKCSRRKLVTSPRMLQTSGQTFWCWPLDMAKPFLTPNIQLPSSKGRAKPAQATLGGRQKEE